MYRFSEATRVLAALLVAATLCSAPPMMWPSSNDDPWNDVAKLTRRASYTFVDRNRSCIDGKIKEVDDRAVTIVRGKAPEVTMERAHLLRITSGGWAGGVIFSGRSSWSDVVRIVGPRFHPDIAVVMKSGQEHKGKLLSASDVALTLERSRKRVNISKDEVSTVSYIRLKPLGDS